MAYGATIQAGILSGVDTAQVQDILLLDITPLSLGTDVKRNGVLHMSTIIPRNTAIPIEKTERYNTAADGQTRIRVQVLQGEHELAENNHKIDETTIGNITPGPAGSEKIDVTFKIDSNGLFQAVIRDVRTGNCENLTITKDKMNLPSDEI